MEQKLMNYPSFPLSKVTEDLKKEWELDLSHDNNAVCEKKLQEKKDISNAIETQIVYQAFLTEKFIVQQKLKSKTF